MSNTTGYKNWYREWFGSDYLTVYEHRDDEDARQLVKLISTYTSLPPDGKILDVACGNGRHILQMSPHNFLTFGIDLSRELLDQAKKLRGLKKLPFFIQADMRNLPFKPAFHLLLSLFTSFGYFERDETNQHVMNDFASLLETEGDLVIDYLNPEYVKSNLIPCGYRESNEVEVTERRWIENNRVYKEILLITAEEEKRYFESVRMYDIEEMHKMLDTAGIKLKRIFGDYSGAPYDKNSSRMILFGKKE